MTVSKKQSWITQVHHSAWGLITGARNIAASGYNRVSNGVQVAGQLAEKVRSAAAGAFKSVAAAVKATTRGAAAAATGAMGRLVKDSADQVYKAACPNALKNIPFREVTQNRFLSDGEKVRVVRDLVPLIVGAFELSQEELQNALDGNEGVALFQRFRQGLQNQRDQGQRYLARTAAATAGIGGGVLGIAASSLLPTGPMAAGVIGVLNGVFAGLLGVNHERSRAYVNGVIWDGVIGSREEIDREKEIYREEYYNAIQDVLAQAKENMGAEDLEFCDLATQLICCNIPKNILATQIPETLVEKIAETLVTLFNWSLKNSLYNSDIQKREEANRQEKEKVKQFINAYLQGTGDYRELPALLEQAIRDVTILAMAGVRSTGIKGFYDRFLTPKMWSRMANKGFNISCEHLNWVSEARDEVLESGKVEGSEAFSRALVQVYLEHRVKDEKNGLVSKVLRAGPDPEIQKEVKINHYEKLLAPFMQPLLETIAGEIPEGGIALGRRSPLLFIAQEILTKKKIALTVPCRGREIEIELLDFAKDLAQRKEKGEVDCQEDPIDEGINLLRRVLAEQIQEIVGLLHSPHMLKLGLANLLCTDEGESSPPDDLAEMQERDRNMIPKDSLGVTIEKKQLDFLIEQSVYNLRRKGFGKLLYFFLNGQGFTDLVTNNIELVIRESINENTKEKVWRKIISNLSGVFKEMIGLDLEISDERDMQDKLKTYTEKRVDLYLKKREAIGSPLSDDLREQMLGLIDAVFLGKKGINQLEQDSVELRGLDEDCQAVCLRITRDLKKKKESWESNRKLKESALNFRKIAENAVTKEQDLIFSRAKREIVEGRAFGESKEAPFTQQEKERLQKIIIRLNKERIKELMKEQYNLEHHEMEFCKEITEHVKAEIREKFFNHHKISGKRAQRLLIIEKNEFQINAIVQQPEYQEKIKRMLRAYLKARGNEGTAQERLERANIFSLEQAYNRALWQRADFVAEFVVESVVNRAASPFRFVAATMERWSHSVSRSFNSLTNRSWSIFRGPLKGFGWLVGKVKSAVLGFFRKIGACFQWVANHILFLRLEAWVKEKIRRRLQQEINAVLKEKLTEGVHEYLVHDILEKAIEEFSEAAQESPSVEEAV